MPSLIWAFFAPCLAAALDRLLPRSCTVRLINEQYGTMYAASNEITAWQGNENHVLRGMSGDHSIWASTRGYTGGKTNFRMEMQEDGSYTFINEEFGVLFAESRGVVEGDHTMWASPQLDSPDARFQMVWNTTDASLRLINQQYGVLYAANGGAVDGDHSMWATPQLDYDNPNARFHVEVVGSCTIKLINEAYGVLYAASTGTVDGDHTMWVSPQLDSDSPNAHFRMEMQQDESCKLFNEAYGVLYAATTGAVGGDHTMRATPQLDYDSPNAHFRMLWKEGTSDVSLKLYNQQYGILYAASTGAVDGDHTMWATPQLDYDSPNARFHVEVVGQGHIGLMQKNGRYRLFTTLIQEQSSTAWLSVCMLAAGSGIVLWAAVALVVRKFHVPEEQRQGGVYTQFLACE